MCVGERACRSRRRARNERAFVHLTLGASTSERRRTHGPCADSRRTRDREEGSDAERSPPDPARRGARTSAHTVDEERHGKRWGAVSAVASTSPTLVQRTQTRQDDRHELWVFRDRASFRPGPASDQVRHPLGSMVDVGRPLAKGKRNAGLGGPATSSARELAARLTARCAGRTSNSGLIVAALGIIRARGPKGSGMPTTNGHASTTSLSSLGVAKGGAQNGHEQATTNYTNCNR